MRVPHFPACHLKGNRIKVTFIGGSLFLESCNDLEIGLSWFVLAAVGCLWSVGLGLRSDSSPIPF